MHYSAPTALAALAMLATIPSSQASNTATMAITVKQANGMPVRDAVVTIYPTASGAGQAIRFPWAMDMAQANVAFTPGTLIVPAGATVRFPNRDKVRHSIYSFSKSAKIDIQLYGKDETRSHTFSVPGNVALGCKIHDQMRGYVKVVNTPYAAKTDQNGIVRIGQLPGGAATIKVWHPQLRSRTGELSEAVTIANGQASTRAVSVDLRPAG
jgi:hypothetical protein